MSETPQQDSNTPEDGAGRSVLEFLSKKTGEEAPRVTLREEESASVPSPLIDPSSKEKLSIPEGRGTYQFLGEIARGGMGIILKGHDTDLGRDVAVKVLDKRLADRDDVVQRFVEEAQIGGQLQHPGIVPVYELGLMADERPYFTMKLVKGRTLATLLSEREGPEADRRRLIDVFESVCQTMAYAHSRGVIHRDLKPANIMVGAFGEVQVVDWGLAKVLSRGGTADEKRARDIQTTSLTILETVRSDGSGSGSESMVGSILGTPSYMPPEQASGQVDRLDERSDVFALGAILCEILTGLPPYVGERDIVISAAALGELDAALERLDACSADAGLVKLTKQCLVAAPAARPANAAVLAERLHEYVVSVEERAQAAQVEAAEARVRAQAERKSRQLTTALGVAVLGVVIAAGGGWLWVQNERATRERAEAERVRLAAEEARALDEKIGGELNEAARLRGAERYDEALDVAERAKALADGGGASPELEARIQGVLQELQAAREESRRTEELAQDTERLLDELYEAFEPQEGERGATDKLLAERYAAVFASHGIDLDEGSLDQAAGLLTERNLGADVALVLDSWAEARRAGRDGEGALRLLELAHSVDPDPLRADLREALANRELSELRYLAQTDLRDQPARTIGLLAAAFERLGEDETALEVYRAGVDLHPDSFELNYWLGRMLTPPEMNPGDPDEMREAVGYYRAALSKDPRSASVRYYLGRLHSKLGEHATSLAHFDAGLELRPGHGPFLYHRASQLQHIGRRAEALELFRATSRISEPPWLVPWSLHSISSLQAQRGDLQAALETQQRAYDYLPFTAQFIANLVERHVAMGREEDLEAVQVLLERHANSETFNNFAWSVAIHRRGDAGYMDQALESANLAVRLDPQNGGHWNTLGVVRYYAGDLEGCVDALLESERLLPRGDELNWLFLSRAEAELGEQKLSRAYKQRVQDWLAKNSPDDPEMQTFFEESADFLKD